MNHTTPTRGPSEQGYILVGVMFMLALLVIAMTVAAPKIAKSIQRDREVETMHRGKQYARAVKLYYKQFGAYPPNIDALVKTNEIRFLRKKYIDPTTGKDEWKVIHLGQNKAPTAFGFFGVPLNGAGAGGGLCGNALPSSTGPGSGSSTSSTFGSSSSSSFGSSGSSFGSSSGSSFGSSSGSSFGSSNPTAGCPSDTSGSGSSTSASTASADPNAANSNNANGATDPNATNGTTAANGAQTGSGSTASGTGSTSAFGQPGQTFGGAGIMGFSPNSPKQSILVYKKKTHYNEWEFVYDPIAEQMMMQGGGGGNLGNNGLGTNPTGNSGFGGSTGIGGGNTGIGGGSSGGIGSPTSGPFGGGSSPTQPQQQQ